MSYASELLREQLARGPQPDEGFFRMKATGAGETHWFNVTPDKLSAIADLLDEEEVTGKEP
jgi:hypothetical protein